MSGIFAGYGSVNVVVRHAQPADERAIFDLFISAHAPGLGRFFPYSLPKVEAAIQNATRRRGSIIGVIDAPDRPGLIAAAIYLVPEAWWWSEAYYLQARLTIVRQTYRKRTGYAEALLRFAEEMRKSLNDYRPEGSPPLVLELSYVQEDPRKVRLFDRWFSRWGRKVGGVYLSGLDLG